MACHFQVRISPTINLFAAQPTPPRRPVHVCLLQLSDQPTGLRLVLNGHQKARIKTTQPLRLLVLVLLFMFLSTTIPDFCREARGSDADGVCAWFLCGDAGGQQMRRREEGGKHGSRVPVISRTAAGVLRRGKERSGVQDLVRGAGRAERGLRGSVVLPHWLRGDLPHYCICCWPERECSCYEWHMLVMNCQFPLCTDENQ